VLGALEREHDVFAPTLPGHYGADDMPVAEPPTAVAMADAIERRLDQEGIDTPHVAGNSLGGWIALELARRGRARSVVALSPAGAWDDTRSLSRVVPLVTALNGLMARVDGQLDFLLSRPRGRRMLVGQAIVHGDRLTPAAAKEHLLATAHAPIQAALMMSFAAHQFEPLAKPLGVPVRFAWGDHDRVLPSARFAEPLLKRVPGAEFVVLKGVGHVPMSDDPVLVAKTILEVTRRATRP
jgi:pimeloyl-ACP methyl ester carboxylesterase